MSHEGEYRDGEGAGEEVMMSELICHWIFFKTLTTIKIDHQIKYGSK